MGANLPGVEHSNTCLHYCFTYGYADLGDYLISKGANDALKNKQGLTCYEGLDQVRLPAHLFICSSLCLPAHLSVWLCVHASIHSSSHHQRAPPMHDRSMARARAHTHTHTQIHTRRAHTHTRMHESGATGLGASREQTTLSVAKAIAVSLTFCAVIGHRLSWLSPTQSQAETKALGGVVRGRM